MIQVLEDRAHSHRSEPFDELCFSHGLFPRHSNYDSRTPSNAVREHGTICIYGSYFIDPRFGYLVNCGLTGDFPPSNTRLVPLPKVTERDCTLQAAPVKKFILT